MDADFEAQVLSKLVLTINVPGPDGVPIGKEDIGNIMFTNDVIKMAATEVQSLPAWQGSKKVQALRFSNRWVASWLGRVKHARRKITAENKAGKRPPVEDVRVSPSAA